MMRTNPLAALRNAGGKWFLDTKLLLLASPIVITTSVLTSTSIPADHRLTSPQLLFLYLQLTIVNVAALAVCATYIVVFAKTVFKNRNRANVPLAAVISFSASVGALKGVLTGLFCWALAIEPDLQRAIASRILQTVLLGAWLIPAVSLVGYRLELLRNQREALVAERVQVALSKPDSADTRKNIAALNQLTKLFRTELQAVATDSSNASNLAYAGVIRKLVSEELRPLSHRLWDQENRNLPGFSLQETLKAALFGFTEARLIVALVYFATFLPSIARSVDLVEALARGAHAALVIYLAFWLASYLKIKSNPVRLIWMALVTGFAAVVSFYTGQQLFGFLASFRPIETILSIWIWLFELAFISAFLIGIRRSQDALSAELAELLGPDTLDQAAQISQARILNRDLANYLHGQVQNKLLSVALNLERADPNETKLNAALANIENILDSANSKFEYRLGGNLSQVLSDNLKQWGGFVEVYLDVAQECEAISDRVKILVIQVVEEAVANSIRHGLAKHIQIGVRRNADRIEIEILDDGLGPRNGKPGLGSSLFKNVSNGNYKFEPQSFGGSKLTLAITT